MLYFFMMYLNQPYKVCNENSLSIYEPFKYKYTNVYTPSTRQKKVIPSFISTTKWALRGTG